MEKLIKKLFERCEYETLPVIYKGKCNEIPDDVWEDIVNEHEEGDEE